MTSGHMDGSPKQSRISKNKNWLTKKGGWRRMRGVSPEWGNWRGQVMCKTKLSIADNHPSWWTAGHSVQVSPRAALPASLSALHLLSLPPAEKPASRDVSASRHGALVAPAAGRSGLGHQRQVRCQLSRQMQRGAVRRDAALHTDCAGWLRLLPGLRRWKRRALLPHGVGHARSQVRTRAILRVLQGWRRLRGRVRHLQRYRVCACLHCALILLPSLLHQFEDIIHYIDGVYIYIYGMKSIQACIAWHLL